VVHRDHDAGRSPTGNPPSSKFRAQNVVRAQPVTRAWTAVRPQTVVRAWTVVRLQTAVLGAVLKYA